MLIKKFKREIQLLKQYIIFIRKKLIFYYIISLIKNE